MCSLVVHVHIQSCRERCGRIQCSVWARVRAVRVDAAGHEMSGRVEVEVHYLPLPIRVTEHSTRWQQRSDAAGLSRVDGSGPGAPPRALSLSRGHRPPSSSCHSRVGRSAGRPPNVRGAANDWKWTCEQRAASREKSTRCASACRRAIGRAIARASPLLSSPTARSQPPAARPSARPPLRRPFTGRADACHLQLTDA